MTGGRGERGERRERREEGEEGEEREECEGSKSIMKGREVRPYTHVNMDVTSVPMKCKSHYLGN